MKTQPFPFMKLPIELRLEVYRELLRSDDEFEVDRMKSIWSINHLHSNILQTCRQVYDEAVEVLYGENIFSLYYDPGNPIASRVKRARAFINTDALIDYSGPPKPNKKDIMALTRFLYDHPNLTHLFLHLGRLCGVEDVQIPVENALQGCNSLIDLKIYVDQMNPLTPKSIAFYWRLDSIIKRNRERNDAHPQEKMTRELINDAAAYPPSVKPCTHPRRGAFSVKPCNCYR